MKTRALALVPALALALAAPAAPALATAAALHRHVLATCTARGGNATCTAGWGVSDRDRDDTAAHPARIIVHVYSALPGQRADVSWTSWCDTPAGRIWSFGFRPLSLRTPVSEQVSEPPQSSRCGVTAAALLPNRHSRFLEVEITYWN